MTTRKVEFSTTMPEVIMSGDVEYWRLKGESYAFWLG